MASFVCATCQRPLSRHATVCPECGGRVIPTGKSAQTPGAAGSGRSALRWVVGVAGVLLLAWIAYDFLGPGAGSSEPAAAAPVAAAAVSSSAAPAATTASDGFNLPAPAVTPGPARVDNRPPATEEDVKKATAVQSELMRLAGGTNTDVGTDQGPVTSWLDSGTPEQVANRARLARVLMRCAREVNTDGTDPEKLPALRACEDRMMAGGSP